MMTLFRIKKFDVFDGKQVIANDISGNSKR